MILGMKDFLNCKAVITGITTRAEISKIPTVGIAKEIVIAERIIKIVLINLTLIPLTVAETSSNVINKNYSNKNYKTHYGNCRDISRSYSCNTAKKVIKKRRIKTMRNTNKNHCEC